MYTITKRPIFILSAPRTGSTILGKYIKDICKDPKMNYFNEPESLAKNRLSNLQRYSSKRKNYVVKTHLNNLHKYPQHLVDFFTTDESVFRIRIRRRNFIEQVASLYISIKRNKKWHYNIKIEPEFVPDIIDIDKNMLEQQIRYLYKCNQALSNSKLHFDLDLYYEDLPVIDNLNLYRTPKPTNYQVLLDTVKEITSQMRDRNF